MHNRGTPKSVGLRELAEEFEKTYGDLEEKSRRVSDSVADQLAQQTKCPLEIARVAVQIESDTLLTGETACKLLIREYDRLTSVGYGVPPVPTYEFNFAVLEGRWIEFLHSKFTRRIEETTREISNIEQALKGMSINDTPKERIINLIELRRGVRQDYILPLLKRWLEEHTEASRMEAGAAFASALLKISYDQALPILEQTRPKLLEFFSFLKAVVKRRRTDSRALELAEEQLNRLEALLSPELDELEEEAIAELLIQIAPRKKVEAPKTSKYVIVHTPIPRSGMVGPLLQEPIDFLERDIRLAKRREKEIQSEKLTRSIDLTFKTIIGDLKDDLETAAKILHETHKRFDLPVKEIAAIKEQVEKYVEGKIGVDRINSIKEYIFNVLDKNIMQRKILKEVNHESEKKLVG